MIDDDWDTSSKPKRIKATKGTTALVDLSYDYVDANSKQTLLQQKVTDGTNGDVTTNKYDALDRLELAETRNGGALKRSFHYDFDNASNRRDETFVNGASTTTTTYRYNEANQLCWERAVAMSDPLPACNAPPSGATSYVHDANGNEVSNSAGRSFAYNVRNQVTSHTSTGGTVFAATHLGEGQSELTQFGSPTLHNSALGLQVRTTSSGNYFYIREPDGSPLGSTYPDGGRAYYLGDALGSVLKLTDVNGAVLNSYSYEPFGADLSTSGTTSNYIKYAGGFDATGSGRLYHFGARYYDPQLGRWTQPDPLDQVGDLREGNRYVYVAGDPVNNIDPDGRHLFYCGLRGCGFHRHVTEAISRRGQACKTAAAAAVGADLIYSKAARQRWYRPRGRGGYAAAIGCGFGLAGIG